jgi:hypothetical protein
VKADSTILNPEQNDSMGQHQAAPPIEKEEARTINTIQKIMRTVLWDSKGFILVDFLPMMVTVNTVLCVKMLQKLQCAPVTIA